MEGTYEPARSRLDSVVLLMSPVPAIGSRAGPIVEVMGIFDRLKEKLPAKAAGLADARRRGTEEALRARLEEDPNDREALLALAEMLAAPHAAIPDPLTASHEPIPPAVNRQTALWALAEDYAGSPHAWVPLIELARLLLADDEDGALRRLATACDRETSGKALAQSIAMLREHGCTSQALSLGVAKWNPASQDRAVGMQLVTAALEARDPGRARELVSRLSDAFPGDADFASLEAAINRLEGDLSS